MIFRNCDFCSQTQHHAAPSSTGWSQRRWYLWTHIQIYIFRSSIPDGMEFLLSMEQFPPDDVLESLYKLRIRGYEKLKTVLQLYNMEIHQKKAEPDYHRLKTMVKKEVSSRIWEWWILRPGTDIMKQAPWSRIIGNNVAFKEDKENVGNGKLTGSVRKETNAVSGTMVISVQCLRHRPLLLQNLRRHKMWEIQREPKVLEGCSPSVKMSRLPCKAHLKSTCTNPSCESCILQSVCFSRQKIDANFEKCVLMHTVGLMNSLPKSLKKEWGGQKCSGYVEGYTTIGLYISGYGAAEIFIDFTEERKKMKPIRCVQFTKTRIASRHHSRPKTIAGIYLPRWSSTAKPQRTKIWGSVSRRDRVARAMCPRSSVEAGKENPEAKWETWIYLLLTYGKVVSPFTIENWTRGKRICRRLQRVDAHDKQEGFEFRRIGNGNDFEKSDDGYNSQWRSADEWRADSFRQRDGFILVGKAPRGYACSTVAGKGLRGPTDVHTSGPVVTNHFSFKDAKRIQCNTENCVPIVVPRLSTGSSPSSSSTPTTPTSSTQDIEGSIPNRASPRCGSERWLAGGHPLHKPTDVPQPNKNESWKLRSRNPNVVVTLFCLCEPYVTRIQKRLDKNPPTCNDSFSCGSTLTTSQQDGDNKNSLGFLSTYLFILLHHPFTVSVCTSLDTQVWNRTCPWKRNSAGLRTDWPNGWRRTLHTFWAQPGEGFQDQYWCQQWIHTDQHRCTTREFRHWEWWKIRNTRGLGHLHPTGSSQPTFSWKYCTCVHEFGFSVLQEKNQCIGTSRSESHSKHGENGALRSIIHKHRKTRAKWWISCECWKKRVQNTSWSRSEFSRKIQSSRIPWKECWSRFSWRKWSSEKIIWCRSSPRKQTMGTKKIRTSQWADQAQRERINVRGELEMRNRLRDASQVRTNQKNRRITKNLLWGKTVSRLLKQTQELQDNDSFSCGSTLTTSQQDGDNKNSLNKIPFSSRRTWMKSHCVHWLVGFEPNGHKKDDKSSAESRVAQFMNFAILNCTYWRDWSSALAAFVVVLMRNTYKESEDRYTSHETFSST